MALGMNDVNVEKLKETDAVIKQNPGLEKIMVKAKSTWCGGTMTQVTLSEWYAGGNKMTPRPRRFTIMVDEPPELPRLALAGRPATPFTRTEATQRPIRTRPHEHHGCRRATGAFHGFERHHVVMVLSRFSTVLKFPYWVAAFARLPYFKIRNCLLSVSQFAI